MFKPGRLHAIVAMMIALGASAESYAKDLIKIPGAGPSTHVVKSFFERFASTSDGRAYEFVVPPRSIKHAGGIAASDELIFGRIGRPLSDGERGTTKAEIILAQIPVAFVVGDAASVKRITVADLKGIFSGRITNWKELGGTDHAIKLIGREPTEAMYVAMKRAYPFLATAAFDRIFKRDHQVVNFVNAPEGAYALSFGAAPNFADDSILEVEGFSVGVGVGLVYDRRRADDDLVVAVRNYAESQDWHRRLVVLGYLPPFEQMASNF
jgi:hypothetical protein